MRRLHNYYCWNTIEDWMIAQKCGLVNLQETDKCMDIKEADAYLNNLVELAEHDCFPMAIVCLKKKNGYFLIPNSLVYCLFQFLNGEVFLEGENGERIFFENFDYGRKCNVLSAQIHSVWIDISNDSNIN